MKGTRLALLTVLVGMLAACAVRSASELPPPPATTTEERRGDELFKSGLYLQAIQEYDNAAAKGATTASVSYRKGYAYFQQGNWREALLLFAEALGSDPTLAIAYEGAGLTAFQLGMYFDARSYFEKTVALAPGHWVPYAFLAAMYQATGDPRDSEYASKALSLAGGEQRQLAEQTILDAGQRLKAFASQTRKPAELRPMLQGKTEEEVVEVKVSKDGIEERVVSRQESAPPPPGPGTALDPASPAILPLTPPPPAQAAPASQPMASGSAAAPVPAPAPAPSPELQKASAKKEPTPAPAPSTEPQKATKKLPSDSAQTASSGHAEAASPQGAFIIMESSFKTASEAEARAHALQGMGLQASTARADLGARGVWYRVIFGPYQNMTEASAAKTKLASALSTKKLIIIKVQ